MNRWVALVIAVLVALWFVIVVLAHAAMTAKDTPPVKVGPQSLKMPLVEQQRTNPVVEI